MDIEDIEFWHYHQHQPEGGCVAPALCPLGTALVEIERLEKIIADMMERRGL